MLNLFKLTKIPAEWAKLLIFRILKQMFPSIENLELMKIHHRQTMDLIDCLAGDVEYWDFIVKGKTGQFEESRSFNTGEPPTEDNLDQIFDIQRPPDLPSLPETSDDYHGYSTDGNHKEPKSEAPDPGLQRWNDSPLITGAKMGLDEFVEKILEVYPQSVNILDVKGMNIIQVTIPLGHQKIFNLVASRVTGSNPLLPYQLLHARDEKNNTILHYAAEVTVSAKEASALQMQLELQWFEKVQKLMPKDLQYSRNAQELTAQELFSENHKTMAESGKNQLTDLGKTCSSLVAAFVFASSFSIPGFDSKGSEFAHKAAFKVFTHSFVFGLSCAATALVLFLSLVTSSYRERDFRRSLPTKFFFAGLSFILALVSLLVAFSCNIFLQIYSGRRVEAKELIPFVCELTVFPAFTLLVLFYRDSSFGVLSVVRHVWR